MKILVSIKQVPARDSQLRIDSSGRWIQESDLSFETNEPDAFALEEALRLTADLDVLAGRRLPSRLEAVIRESMRRQTLVLEAENDQFFAGQPRRIFDALTCPKELITFPGNEGGGEHCHEGAMALFHQRTFDWLDTVLTA